MCPPPHINHADPAHYPGDHALNPLVNHLHWGWQGGYVFLALEGRYTRSTSRLSGYVYHMANDQNLMTVTQHKDFELPPANVFLPIASPSFPEHPSSLKSQSLLESEHSQASALRVNSEVTPRVDADVELAIKFDISKVFDAVHTIRIRPEGGGESTHSAEGDLLTAHLKVNIEHAFTLMNVTAKSVAANVSGNEKASKPIPPHTTPYTFPVPAHFPQPQLPADNPLTVEGIALGKRLFFEKRLSGNNTQSCASCHQPDHAFADAGKAFSVGIDGRPGTRRAMPLFNLAWSRFYTWDGRRTRLRDQALAPIQDAREMHQSLSRTLGKLRANKTYTALFARAFDDHTITVASLGLAIEQYLLTIISADAKFDRALRGEAQFTNQEKRGLELFITEYDPARGVGGADCFHCHGGNLFTDYQFKNNGLKPNAGDGGRFQITGSAADRDKFKTPSLRNVELTGPYMHDGRFATLSAVVAHYSSGIHRSDTLDPNIAKHPDGGVHLSTTDQKALVAFLKTLTETRWHTKEARR